MQDRSRTIFPLNSKPIFSPGFADEILFVLLPFEAMVVTDKKLNKKKHFNANEKKTCSKLAPRSNS